LLGDESATENGAILGRTLGRLLIFGSADTGKEYVPFAGQGFEPFVVLVGLSHHRPGAWRGGTIAVPGREMEAVRDAR